MIKKIKIIFIVLFSYLNAFAQNIDVQHYRFELGLNDNNDTLAGEATIILLAKTKISSIEFDLAHVEKGKGMSVKSVKFSTAKLLGISNFVHENNKLSIKISQIEAGDSLEVYISYKGIPADGLIISKNKFGQRTFFADNWPDRAQHWIPCKDDPADKASVEFIVTAPTHYQVISNGVMVEESNLPGNRKLTHWKEDVPLPTKIMVIGVADFAVQYPGEVNGVQVSSWIFPQDREKGFYDYAQALEILAFYINYIGPYPYKKLANVQSKTMFGGMENASAIFYSENSVNGRRQQESLLAHEIVHQWFGDMATEKSFAHIWLSEGFATYLTHVYIESKYGTDSMNYELKKDRLEVMGFVNAGRPVVDPDLPLMDLLNPNSYQKGGWVLHMLRRQLGDSVFRQSIRAYYNTYKGKNADTENLKAIFQKISGKNLDIFFRQWLYKPGIPELKISWKYLPAQKKLTVKVDQLQEGEPFQFQLEIEISSSSGKPHLEKLNITKRSETFTLGIKNKPLKLVADPKTSLLFESSVVEIK